LRLRLSEAMKDEIVESENNKPSGVSEEKQKDFDAKIAELEEELQKAKKEIVHSAREFERKTKMMKMAENDLEEKLLNLEEKMFDQETKAKESERKLKDRVKKLKEDLARAETGSKTFDLLHSPSAPIVPQIMIDSTPLSPSKPASGKVLRGKEKRRLAENGGRPHFGKGGSSSVSAGMERIEKLVILLFFIFYFFLFFLIYIYIFNCFPVIIEVIELFVPFYYFAFSFLMSSYFVRLSL
jgi:hypothetical protein